MSSDNEKQQRLNQLREKAQGIIAEDPGSLDIVASKGIENLIEELHIHQVELEMQNEELRKSQVELEESRSNYADLYDFAPVGYFTFDKNGLILEVNLTGADMLSIERGQLIKMPFSRFIDKDSQDEFYKHRRKVLKTGEKQVCEIKIKKNDIDHFWVSLESNILVNNSEDTNCIASIITDISRRKETEDTLRNSEEKFRTSFDSTNSGMCLVDLKGILTTVNPKICEIFGYDKSELVGMNMKALSHPDDSQISKNDLKKREMGNNDKANYTKCYLSKNGDPVWAEVSTSLVKDQNDEPMFFIAQVIDITERKKAEEALKESEAQLQIRQRMDSIGTLASGIAHDFNNILVSIIGNLSLLNMDNKNLTKDQKECVNDAVQGSTRAAKLIKQFQSFSRSTVSEYSTVDINDISNEVFDILKETTDRLIDKQIEFKKGEFYINADPTELHQVLLNIVINSAQSIEERGAKKGDYIRISAEDYKSGIGDKTGLAEGNYIHILIEDNGVGMSDDVMKRSFDPLFSTKENFNKPGQGLGLAMVYTIVTGKCKGHIIIDSKKGKGATVHIYLPKAQIELKAEGKENIGIKGGTETILVVDDELLVRKFAQKLLTKIGYTVLTAGDGKEALKIYKKQKDSIDTVILDLTMPQMSGKQVFQKMLEIDPVVKVIISSGHSEDYTKEGILSQVNGNVTKPYLIENLAQTVRNVLDL